MADGTSGALPIYLLAGGVVVLMILARRHRFIGNLMSMVVLAGGGALLVFLVAERGRFDPAFSRFSKMLDLDNAQVVAGKETRIRMADDGHFWVRVDINGVRRRMLVDSGATVTALSSDTMRAIGVKAGASPFPMLIETANGTVRADTATVPELRIGNIVARDLPVVTSPSFGDMDVVGMNFLSRLKSWRVEGRTLILTPNHPQGAQDDDV